MAVAVERKSRGADITVGITTSYVADIHCSCVFIPSVNTFPSLCVYNTATGGGTAQEHCGDLVTRQACSQYLNKATNIKP
jgi:hypothetical protein